MGNGKKLKEHIDNKGTNVRKITKETGIRFDFALRPANALEIDVNVICSASPFFGAITEEEIFPALPDELNSALETSRPEKSNPSIAFSRYRLVRRRINAIQSISKYESIFPFNNVSVSTDTNTQEVLTIFRHLNSSIICLSPGFL